MEGHVRYKRISDEDRERLVEAFEGHNADYLELADTLGIKRSTARSIVATYLRSGRRHKLHRGGAKNQKMDDEMRARIQRIIDVNPLVTLQQIKRDLEAALPLKPTVTISTISRALDGMFITLKLAEDVPDARNAPRNLDLRVEYGQWFLAEGVVAHTVFIDETGYNVWTRRSYGRAQRGQPVRRVVHRQRGKRCNVTFAVSGELGLVHHEISCETVTRASFEDFLAETARQCAIVFPPGEPVVLIYDNARPHVRARLPPDVDPAIQLKRLPPYSPFLNFCENAHSAFKAAVKRDVARPEIQQTIGDREAAQQAGVTMEGWRVDVVCRLARRNVDAITQEKCMRWYLRMQTYMPLCLARQHIDG